MQNEVMIDLETLSDHANAVIVSIGAVCFNVEEGVIDTFYRNVNPVGQKELGLHISPRTLEWWKKQDKRAIDALRDNQVSLKQMLEDFADWYGTRQCPVWSKSVDFDCAIMASAYRAVYGESATPPWKYWNTRCMRTVESFYPMKKEERVGVYHNALNDAETQTKHLLDFYNKFGLLE